MNNINLLLTLPMRSPMRIISTLSIAKTPNLLDIPEQIITVPLRSIVELSVDIVDISGNDEFLFNDLEIFRNVKVVDIGKVAIVAVPTYERVLSKDNGL